MASYKVVALEDGYYPMGNYPDDLIHAGETILTIEWDGVTPFDLGDPRLRLEEVVS